MALVLPFISCHHHHHHRHPIFHHQDHNPHYLGILNPMNVNLLPKHSLHTIFTPPQHRIFATLTTALPIHHHNSLLQEITELCESKSLTEALNLIQEKPDNVFLDPTQRALALGIILEACAVAKNIEIGRKLHELIWASEHLRNNPILNTRIITMYSMCCSPLDSQTVFDQLQGKNLYQWNALLSGYTGNKFYYDALCVFDKMISVTGFTPDNFTFPCVIKACGGIFDVGLGRAVHGMVVKLNLVSDVFVGNALIAMYGKFGIVEDAHELFDCMPERNLVSWNSMISVLSENGYLQESFEFFRKLLVGLDGLVPDSATVVTILPACAGEEDEMMGKVVHGLAAKLGLNADLMVSNALIDMYSKCGFLAEARIAFYMNENKNVVSWNSMIGGYAREGDVDGTFDLLRKMQMESEKLQVDEITLLNVLPVCLEASELLCLKELHGYSIRHGFENDELLANAFITGYARCGLLSTSECLFDRLECKTVSTWNALIGCYAQNGDSSKALDTFFKMTHSGIGPDSVSIGSLLLACCHSKSQWLGKQIHGFVLRNGLEVDYFILTSLLSLYFSCEVPIHARFLFDNMTVKRLVSWNVMIAGYSQRSLLNAALDIFRQMMLEGIQPNEITMVSLLGAISQLSALRLGQAAHCFALKVHLMKDSLLNCSIIDMYAKSGSIESSQKVFDKLQVKDSAACSAMISGYAIHGLGKEADGLFQKMVKLGLKPNHFTFIGILMACNHAGLTKQGLKYLTEMDTVYNIKAKLEHYACVVDMLGRAGQFANALELIARMTVQPDARVWSSLLSSCRNHNELDLGKIFAEKLLEVEPNRAESYVLVSNLFAGFGKWDDVRRLRGRMKEIGLQKNVGCSWTEIGGRSYSFVAGDDMLPDSVDTTGMWNRLQEKVSQLLMFT